MGSATTPGPLNNYGAGTLRSAPFVVASLNEHQLGFRTNGASQITVWGDSGGPSYASAAHYGPGPWLTGVHLDGAATGVDESTAVLRQQIKHTMGCGSTAPGACKATIELVGGSGWTNWPELTSLGDGSFSQGQFALDNFLPFTFFTPAALSSTKRLGGDFNGDHNLDFMLVVAPPPTGGSLRLAYSQGSPFKYELGGPSFPFADEGGASFAGWAQVSQPLVGDYNGDGRDDVALLGGPGWLSIPVAWSVANGSNPAFYVTNRGVADFPGLAGTSGVKMTVGDFNGDGRDDVALLGVAGWGSMPIAFSGGGGTFTVNYISVGSSFPSWAQGSTVTAVAGDFNGDGRDDVALVGGSGWLSIPVAFSAGDGSSTWVTNYQVADFPVWAQTANARPVAGDFDGDGRDDIALVGGAGTGWSTVPIAFSLGDGQFRVTNGGASTFASQAQGETVRPFALRGRGPERPVHAATKVSVARDGNGLCDVFYMAADGEVFHNHQLVPNGGWSGEMPMGGVVKNLVAATNGDGRLELFGVGLDDALWHNYETYVGGGWSGWVPIGGIILPSIAVTTDVYGRLSVFAFGTDNAVYNIAQVNAGSSAWASWWTTVGGQGARLAAATNADGRLEEFHIGLDGVLYHSWQQWADGAWSGQQPLGPPARARRGRDPERQRQPAGLLRAAERRAADHRAEPAGWGGDTWLTSSVRQFG